MCVARTHEPNPQTVARSYLTSLGGKIRILALLAFQVIDILSEMTSRWPTLIQLSSNQSTLFAKEKKCRNFLREKHVVGAREDTGLRLLSSTNYRDIHPPIMPHPLHLHVHSHAFMYVR